MSPCQLVQRHYVNKLASVREFSQISHKGPFRLNNELASSLVVKGDGDLIKHILTAIQEFIH